MPLSSKLIHLWNNLVRHKQIESDLNDELHAYVDEMTERRIRDGVDPDSARHEVMSEMGGMEALKERIRAERVGSRVESWAHRHSVARPVRRLATIVITLVVALGVLTFGEAIVFDWLDPIMLAPPPQAQIQPDLELALSRCRVGFPEPSLGQGIPRLFHVSDEGNCHLSYPRFDADNPAPWLGTWLLLEPSVTNRNRPLFGGTATITPVRNRVRIQLEGQNRVGAPFHRDDTAVFYGRPMMLNGKTIATVVVDTPENQLVSHHFVVSPDGQRLNLATMETRDATTLSVLVFDRRPGSSEHQE